MITETTPKDRVYERVFVPMRRLVEIPQGGCYWAPDLKAFALGRWPQVLRDLGLLQGEAEAIKTVRKDSGWEVWLRREE